MVDSKPTLLLIEDNSFNIKFILGLLVEVINKPFFTLRFEIVVKQNLEDTKKYLENNTPDIIISDLTLTDATAEQTLEYLKNFVLDIPIVILTGDAISEIAINAIHEGFQDYLVKGDFDANTLAKSIMYSIERHKLVATIRNNSLIDEATYLYNKKGFRILSDKYYKNLQRENKGAGILYADLNGLKTVNDTYGHKKGDNYIFQAAQILQKASRSSDIAGRLGGDEFAVFFYNCKPDNGPLFINRVNELIQIYNSQSTDNYKLSMSMGFAYCDCCKDNLEDALSKADQIMYEEKRKHHSSRKN